MPRAYPAKEALRVEPGTQVTIGRAVVSIDVAYRDETIVFDR